MDTEKPQKDGCIILKQSEYNDLLKKVKENKSKQIIVRVQIRFDETHTPIQTPLKFLSRPGWVEFYYDRDIEISSGITSQVRRILRKIENIHYAKIEAVEAWANNVISCMEREKVEIAAMSFWQLYKRWRKLKNEN